MIDQTECTVQGNEEIQSHGFQNHTDFERVNYLATVAS